MVDDHMRTSNPHIYAVGDTVEKGTVQSIPTPQIMLATTRALRACL
ncbi:hypothetical protein [Rothia sp. LK2492]